MHNVDSQDARDLIPALGALLKELKSEESKKIYKDNNSSDANSPESPEEIILCKDNKLYSASLTPFIVFLNTKSGPGGLQIIDWFNNKAQRGKDFLDAHFQYINIYLRMVIMKGDIKLSDPKVFYDCLAYMSGMRASSVILLDEYSVAQKVFDPCKSVVCNKKIISHVHHIS